MVTNISNDLDPLETNEWIEAIESVLKNDGKNEHFFLIKKILEKINIDAININFKNYNFINSIHYTEEPRYPGNLKIEKNIRSVVCWNAIMIVLRASKKNLDLGGHISSFQSFATVYEVCFNHFFRASNKYDGGDLIYFQGHVSPGIYARAFLEDRLTETQLDNFRQEICGFGLSSYPHPNLMPDFWQFPTVSMGLSSVCAIYQARFLKYLHNRNLKNTTLQTVYAFLGDGEMDEPESKGAVVLAAREQLDNLIFIINCNLQRLDGPVFGNGKIINELSSFFSGCGWHVIKVIWSSQWDTLLDRDDQGFLKRLMNETVDGNYQTLKSKNGAYVRKHFFERYEETKKLVENFTDSELWALKRGGHDPKKIYAAFHEAKKIKEKPVVILIHTVKGYGLGEVGESKNISHQIKTIKDINVKYLYDRFKLNAHKSVINNLSYIKFLPGSEEYHYIHQQRKKLYGYLPKRLKNFSNSFRIPTLNDFKILLQKQSKPISTTMIFIKILNILLRFPGIQKKIVPIIADEARTFGMEALFQKIGIYNHLGQLYTPSDKEKLLYYKEEKSGQILQEGINELGACASWLAAATAYSTNDFPMIPFYIYYSMFGFQRVGDLLWACGDQNARGFLIGATSGRTTLNGEGLQHADGHSHILSLTIPNCVSYDPAYGYELSVIIQDGLQRMYGNKQENIFYYITTVNENYLMPSMSNIMLEGICKGIYLLETFSGKIGRVQLLGSGAILERIRKAASILHAEYDIGSDVYSVTSFTELARNGQDCTRWNFLNPLQTKKIPYVSSIIKNYPTIAATDYIKVFAEQIRAYIPSKIFHVLGTDGFGRSDSRKNLRNFFEIDENYIISAAINALVDSNTIDQDILLKVFKNLIFFQIK
ncbi:pyruvate dehydrogenase E1 component [Buchnera aphidicola (Cinara tujafilina)]|uniref:Pyruvate dehydrogenase E1 component n=1 Tax=Buchnera aphidicola (Cinara tujafilina) TaxID=261317 RepID=F7WZ70_9GAMM|nr:pyruvate dehydrogenase (acetyl-transferring), homodimeric type [Buchnera aphidicola]AEH39724.1 pyruvate dehydrogenase E1 component [Buchnera aphidicola (Cinara tujafilina)]